MKKLWTPLLISLSLVAPATANPGFFPLEVSVNFPNAPAGSGSPSRTAGGATRAGQGCVTKGEGITPLTAVVPSNNVGTTVAAAPTLFLYLPQNKAVAGEVVIVDDQGEEVYFKDDFTVPESLQEKAGIVRLELADAQLEAGKTYKWTFALICNRNDRSSDEAVQGIFERVADAEVPPSPSELSPAELAAKAAEFAQAGIWNETLIYTAQLRQFNEQEWKSLLKAVDLENLANIPFAD